MLSLMIFIFLCFLGMLGMLYFMLRNQEKMCQTLREEHAQTRLLLRALESRLENTVRGTVAPAGMDSPREPEAPSLHDPLLRLTFDEPAAPPAKPAVDPALELHMDDLPLPNRG